MDGFGRHQRPGDTEADHELAAAGPTLALDELLTQLIERAQDVRQAHERLRGLLAASQMITGDLSLPAVLRSIVEAACRLVNARYGAIGVIDAEGRGLQSFISIGIDEATAARIGHLPTGKGLLGALIDDPVPIRLAHLADDPRSSGFPANHPPMEGFLGVPIRVRDAIFGNLYLTEPQSGEFTADDEEVVLALAATAGVAIENARLFEQAQHRQRWLQASMEITTQLLSVEGEEPLALIARQARDLADADLVTVVLPMPGRDRLMVEVVASSQPVELAGYTFPADGTLSEQAITTGRPVMLDDASQQSLTVIHQAQALPVGPIMAVPLVGGTNVRGALVVGRLIGRERFDTDDLGMATTFANHATVALELADARASEQRVALLEDRDRIARDLHDHVIQRLFAAGLTLDGLIGAVPREVAGRLSAVVDEVDETIRQIRTSIFELRGHLGPATGSVRTQILEVVGEIRPLLTHEPRLRFEGPIDSVVPDEMVPDILAVLRESLTNVARHAQADTVDLVVRAGPSHLSVVVADNGVGLGATKRRSGLDNLRRRAEEYNGSMTLQPNRSHTPSENGRRGPGTRIEWTVPLP